MVAVTIDMASRSDRKAATQYEPQANLRLLVLGEDQFMASGLPDPSFLMFRLFEFVDDDDVLFIGSDLVCLRAWDPRALRGGDGRPVCVRDRLTAGVRDDCNEWRIPPEEYFSAAMMLINRRHAEWLSLAEDLALSTRRPLRFAAQSALNAARWRLRLPVQFIDRRYNWAGYGSGSLCRRLPVVLARRGNEQDQGSFAAAVKLPPPPPLELDLGEAERLGGTTMARRYMRRSGGRVLLRGDGVLVPAGLAGAEYWFIHRLEGRPVLAFASETEVVRSFARAADGSWHALSPAPPDVLTPTNEADAELPNFDYSTKEAAIAERIARRRTFEYVRVGHDRRRMMLLADGRIGEGRDGCEQNWCVRDSGAGHELLVAADDRVTGVFREDPAGTWRGRWVVHERMPVELIPLAEPAAGPAEVPRNGDEFRFFAMRRSGHHAIMLWFCAHFDPPVCHLNDVPMFGDPFTGRVGLGRSEEVLGRDVASGGPVDTEVLRLRPKRCLMFNYEDPDLQLLGGGSVLPGAARIVGVSQRVWHVLCLRDPYNMLASRYAIWREDVLAWHPQVLARWRTLALEFLGRTAYLPDKVCVNFNSWFASPAYRRALSGRLGLPFTDAGFRAIPTSVPGDSSFDRSARSPQELDVLGRWKVFRDDPRFWRCFDAVPDVHSLSTRIFGDVRAGAPAVESCARAEARLGAAM